MAETPKKTEFLPSQKEADRKAIQHLKQAIADGKHWYLALLEAIGMWKSTEENYGGCHYSYLIDGEAFDWLLLAERLCEEINGLIPEEERIALLFFDQPPIEVTKEEFKRLIGAAKYKAYLNYLYGILVEEALLLTVVEEIRKERRASGLPENATVTDEAYRHVYGATQETLLSQFRKEKRYRQRKSTTLNELREFTYWLFKYRLKNNEKARVASDTKKALLQLHRYWTKKRQLPAKI